MSNSGHDRRGLFGDIVHYDEHGHRTGVSRPNIWGGYNDYDASGRKTGSSMRNFTGGFNHYDNKGHKTGRSDPAFFGGMNHYDNDGKKIGHSDPTFFGGWDYRKERMEQTAISSKFAETQEESSYNFDSSNSTILPPNNAATVNAENTELQEESNSGIKTLLIAIVCFIAVVVVVKIALILMDAPYVAYEKSLARLQSDIQCIDYNKYVDSSDWLFSISRTEAEFDCKSFQYHLGEDVIQKNEVYCDGVYNMGFEKQSSQTQAAQMCLMWSQVIDEVENIYHNSDYYLNYGKLLEEGKTISFRDDVNITAIDTRYNLHVGSSDTDYFLEMDSDGNGSFISKTYTNSKEYYYWYRLSYIDGEITYFQLDNYSTPYGFGYYDKDSGEMVEHTSSGNGSHSESSGGSTSTNSHSSNSKYDSYNSGRYSDADSFAEDYYEEFYDYGDYEDDEDAYDAAVDYWNEWND